MDFFKGFYKMRFYILGIMALFAIYVWAGISGTKFTGDDDQLKEERTGRQGHGSNFYHK